MEQTAMKNWYAQYNRLIRESDEMYHNAAKKLGLSDCAFWIFYLLCTEETPQTQSDICHAVCMPKQTVHSALKKLTESDYVGYPPEGKKRGRQIILTEKGRRFAERTMDQVIKSEFAALEGMDEEERETFLTLFNKYTRLLGGQMKQIKETGEKKE